MTGVISILIYRSWNQSTQYTFDVKDYQLSRGPRFAIAFNQEANQVSDQVSIVGKLEEATGLKAEKFDSKTELEKGTFGSSGDLYSFAIYIHQFWGSVPVSENTVLNATLYYNLSQSEENLGFEMTKTRLGVLISRVLYAEITPSTTSLNISYEPLNGGFEISQLWAYFGPLLV